MKRINDKGSTIVLVLVVFAIVGILAAVALSLSVRNFQMKATDSKVKNNFYSAESVLDQVTVGLQDYISVAYVEAYTQTMESYSTIITADAREARFKTIFLSKLKEALTDPTDATAYDTAVINGLVSAAGVSFDFGSHKLVDNGASITLKDIEISFTDVNDFTSIIKTDINIVAPSMKSITSTSLPDIFSYSLVANSGIYVQQGNLTVNGNVYAGSKNKVNPADNNTTSLKIEGGNATTFTNGSYVISDGDFYVNTNSKVTVGPSAQLWTKNIIAENADLEINANTYVSDDLTLKGKNGTKVKIGNGTSKYFGYGNSTLDSNTSSAIIINGKECNLDLSGLDELVVAGYAYIGTSNIESGTNPTNGNVQMGESISVKGDQIAYLVPSNCVGTNGSSALAGTTMYSKNPMSMDEYTALAGKVSETGSDYVYVNDKIEFTKTGKSLSYYLNGTSVTSAIKTVFNNAKGFVYFYVDLPADKAKEFYSDYFEADAKDVGKINTYTAFYSSGITYNDSASLLYTAGTYVDYDGTTTTLHQGATDDVSSRISRMPRTYEALTTILSTNYNAIETTQKNKTVFENFINTATLDEALSSGNTKSYSYDSNGITYKVIISKEDSVNITQDTSKEVLIVIAENSIVLNSDFKGLAICNGTLDVNGGCHSIDGISLQEARKVLASEVEINGKTYHTYEFFNGGSDAWVGGLNLAGGAAGTTGSDSYTDLISYANWQKK